MDIDPAFACSCSGHRPQKLGGFDESRPLILSIKKALEDEIDLALRDGITTFISGGALGVDTWFAEIVLSKTARLIIARPFPSQDSRWPEISRQRFRSILSKAEVVDVSPDPYQVWKMDVRNRWMVDHSSRLIAVFDGTSGGTANCVNYAKKQNCSITIIDPKTLDQ